MPVWPLECSASSAKKLRLIEDYRRTISSRWPRKFTTLRVLARQREDGNFPDICGCYVARQAVKFAAPAWGGGCAESARHRPQGKKPAYRSFVGRPTKGLTAKIWDRLKAGLWMLPDSRRYRSLEWIVGAAIAL